jgi:tetratricopeptide (TPR) repeat protein
MRVERAGNAMGTPAPAPSRIVFLREVSELKLSVSWTTNVVDGEKVDLYIRATLPDAGREQPDTPPLHRSAITHQGVRNQMTKKLCLIAALSVSLLSLVGCTKVKARMAIKDANEAYAKEDYDTALKGYRRARQIDATSFPELDRMVGYSLIGLYSPEDKSPENVKNADAAVVELRNYLKKRPDDTIAREALINLYLNADRITDAINYFMEWLKTHPADLDAVRSIAQLHSKQGNFNESLNWYEKITLLDAKNPEAFYTYGVVCYEKVAKNPPADMNERLAIIEKGKRALERASQLRPDYFEALVYLSLLHRQQAPIETDPVKQQALVAEADRIRNQAIAINNKRKAAAAAAAGGKKS